MTPCRYCERCGSPVEFSRSHDCTSKNALTERAGVKGCRVVAGSAPRKGSAESVGCPDAAPTRSVSAFTEVGVVPARTADPASATTDAQAGATAAADGPNKTASSPTPCTGSAPRAADAIWPAARPFERHLLDPTGWMSRGRVRVVL